MFYDPVGATQGTLYPVPVPANAAGTIVLVAHVPWPVFAATSDSVTTLPRGELNCLLWNLAARLRVVHHDDSETPYERVRYWLDRKGVTVWDAETGEQLARHEDVLLTMVW